MSKFSESNGHPFANVAPEAFPESLFFTVQELGTELKASLDCLVNESGGSGLGTLVDKIKAILKRRLQISMRLVRKLNNNYVNSLRSNNVP